MTKKRTVRIGVLGLTHDHVWGNLAELKKVRDAVLVAVADPNQPLLERAQKEYGCAAYTDYEAMLEQERLDAVYVYGDNATGVEVAIMAADQGLHVMLEKPMAHSLEGADALLAAVRANQVRLMINWPLSWWPQIQKALAMAQGGDLGELWQVKYRAAHAGPREMGCSTYFCDWLYDPELNGGGALMDYCCYGAVLSRLLLGVPSRVTGVSGRLRKEDIPVEDNAFIIMAYARGLSLAEASWTQIGHLSSYVTLIYGSAGTLLVEPGEKGRVLLATAKQQDGVEVKVPRPPAHLRNASAHFIHCLTTGEEFYGLCNDRIGRDAQEILEAGQISAGTGAEVSLPLKNY